jgi:hypothetical protein
MKGTLRNKLLYSGAGGGLVCFAIFGLLPGSFLGGVMGLNIAGSILGYPVAAGIAARMIVTLSMLIGIMASGLVFTVGGALAGWLVGAAADAATEGITEHNASADAISGK